MAQNDEFSFVRFLKVVKTLYESSTFTQLGKTVGSALSLQPFSGPRIVDEEDTYDTSRGQDDENKRTDTPPSATATSFINILGACTAPTSDADPERKERRKGGKGNTEDRDGATVDTRDTRNPSLLDQMLNCTLGQGDDASDEDTYKSAGSYDEQTLEDSTFDSMTDDGDGYEPAKRGRGRSRRRRRD
jgi:hypothetical protein